MPLRKEILGFICVLIAFGCGDQTASKDDSLHPDSDKTDSASASF